jgi:autotransporter-associated beta strand protein
MVLRSAVKYDFKANYSSDGSAPHRLTIGADGIMFVPGVGGVQDYATANGIVTIGLGANQAWIGKSGNGMLLQGSIIDGGGNSLTIARIALQMGTPNQVIGYSLSATITNMPNIMLAEGGSLTLYNCVRNGTTIIDRIADATSIVSYGGTLSFPQDTQYSANSIYTETVNTLQLAKGTFTHQQAGNKNSAYTNVFTYAGINRTGPTATLIFSGQAVAAYVNRVFLSGQASTNMLGGWAIVVDAGFAGYDTTVDSSGYARGIYGNNGSTGLGSTTSDPNNPYYIQQTAGISASADLTVGGLVNLTAGSCNLALNGHKLTLAKGGLNCAIANQTHTISNGTVTAGTGGDANLYAFTPVAAGKNTKRIDAVIADNGVGKVGLVKSGAYTLTLTQTNTYTGATTINDGTLYLGTAGSISNSPTIELLYGCLANQYYTGYGAAGAFLDVSDQASTWTLGTSQTLKGNGAVIGNVNVNGTLAPGTPDTGMLTVTGNVAFANNSTLRISVTNSFNASEQWGYADTWKAGYSRLKVFGNVNLGTNAILDVESVGTPILNNGNNLFIIDCGSNNAVTGQFKTPAGRVLNEGDVFTAAGTNFQIRYTGNVATLTTNGGYSVVIQVTSKAATTASPGTVIMFK